MAATDPAADVLIGELLARCTVEFEQSTPHIALFEPRADLLPGEAAWEPAVLFGRHPCVRATVEGHEGIFKIDTRISHRAAHLCVTQQQLNGT